ncbi:MAG: GH92 family glycosyl hydrolase, partial [Alistipes sp.]|nr:GH92 family glycosyl hydrolase [Alistipes sp.]
EHTTIEGFAMTQMSGVGWYGDMGNFLVMPTTGELHTIAGREDGSVKGWRSHYDKSSENAEAGWYGVRLADYDIYAESSATPHCGVLRFTYPKSDLSRVQVDLARRVGGCSEEQYVKVESDRAFSGWMRCTPQTGGWGNGDGKVAYTLYFYAELSRSVDEWGFWSADIPDGWARKNNDVVTPEYLAKVAEAAIIRGEKELQGEHIGIFGEFDTRKGEQVELKVGISYVDVEGAKRNFDAEIADKSFNKVRKEAFKQWNNALAKVEVEGCTDVDKRIFYTALYRTMLEPRIHTDVDGRYVGGDFKVHQSDEKFVKRTLFSGWDVFRSQMPLQTIINPSVVNDVICSLMEQARTSGRQYYERWELFNSYTGCMLGNPALSVLADAYAKGIRNYDVEEAYRYAVNSSAEFGNGELGYTVSGTSISHTLEYAYFDWCIAQLAKALGKSDDVETYMLKSQAWRNLFDDEKGWFRPRKADGEWVEWPENARIKEWYGCMEATPYQQGWFVPHEIDALAEKLGGKELAVADLKNFFEKAPADMHWNAYYNHANEPVHHVPFMFNRLGAPHLTQYWSRFICRQAYADKVEGIVGNEDAGQMSAWYVLAAMGLHPVCPGEERIEITSPVFESVTISLDKEYAQVGKFVVRALDNSPENVYIQSAKLNGEPYSKCYINFSDIAAGGELELQMGAEPNPEWGVE